MQIEFDNCFIKIEVRVNTKPEITAIDKPNDHANLDEFLMVVLSVRFSFCFFITGNTNDGCVINKIPQAIIIEATI